MGHEAKGGYSVLRGRVVPGEERGLGYSLYLGGESRRMSLGQTGTSHSFLCSIISKWNWWQEGIKCDTQTGYPRDPGNGVN
jgi:hypothetical protein